MAKEVYDEQARADLCANLAAHYQTDVVTTAQIKKYVDNNKIPFPYFFNNDKRYKYSWGKFKVGAGMETSTSSTAELPKKVVSTTTDSFVPVVDKNYVPFGFFKDLHEIIQSKIFYPVYITGQSGNGKTLSVEQACAKAARELIRVNITKDTDEFDLIGSYQLIDGNTIRQEGPAIVAMRRGAILLLDETDYGSERLLCLQPILEGKPYFDKKTGEIIYPAPGFNIIATANTKGKGSTDGRFIGANVLNEAFLERFAITVEQEYPSIKEEVKIMTKAFASLGKTGEEIDDFIKKLTSWAESIRKVFKEGGIDEVVSTRRLVHIARAYSIFNNRKKSIELCLNRFDEEIKTQLLDFYSKIDVKIDDQAKPLPEVIKTDSRLVEFHPLSPYFSGHIDFGKQPHMEFLVKKYNQEFKEIGGNLEFINDYINNGITVKCFGWESKIGADELMTYTGKDLIEAALQGNLMKRLKDTPPLNKTIFPYRVA